MNYLNKITKYSKELNVLYIEDNDDIRIGTCKLLQYIFKDVKSAIDGSDGLDVYHKGIYDLVITDINIPNMNGLELIKSLKETNPEQKILVISEYDDPTMLKEILTSGVSGFLPKPVTLDMLLGVLLGISRDACIQKENIELLNTITIRNELLLKQNKELRLKSNTIDTKHSQLSKLLTKVSKEDDYFKGDEDEGYENVVIMSDHCDDIIEFSTGISELLVQSNQSDQTKDQTMNLECLNGICDNLKKISNIFMFYTPYLDMIANSLHELSFDISENKDVFIELVHNDHDSVLMLFDAISSDMERFTKRFSKESIAMRNSHHIHRPTELSIRQIIDMIVPSKSNYGDMEFF